MANNLFVPGKGLEFGFEISLSEASAHRADVAARVYGDSGFADEETRIYTVGGHPTLPAGVLRFDEQYAEGVLMREHLIGKYNISEDVVHAEARSTSTMTNAIRLVQMESFVWPDRRNKLGVVSGEHHMKRVIDALGRVGILRSHVEPFVVEDEPESPIMEVASRTLSYLASFGATGDFERLEHRDRLLEDTHDRAVRWAKKGAKTGKGIARLAQKVIS